MEKERKYKLMVKLSVLAAGLIACFWFTWYLTAGQVPVATSLRMGPGWTLRLPFTISRWWDILIGLIWFPIFITLLTNEKIQENENLVYGLYLGLFTGLASGLTVGVLSPLLSLIAFVFVLSLLLGFRVFNLVSGLSFGLACSLGFGLILALVFGLATGIVSTLLLALISIFLIVLKY